MTEEKENSFITLNKVNLSSKVKKKLGLSYLSWADAWNTLKTHFPDATQTVYTRKVKTTVVKQEKDDSLGITKTTTDEYESEIPYFTDGKTCWVKVGVTINNVEYTELYPIMDLRNQSVSLSSVKSTDVNKAIQRAFVKACGRHGLGLYIYRGEDLPEDGEEDVKKNENEKANFDSCYKEAMTTLSTVSFTESDFNKQKEEVINIISNYTFSDDIVMKINNLVKTNLNKKISAATYQEDAKSIYIIYKTLHDFVTTK